MKKTVIIFLFGVIGFVGYSQEQNINFENSSFEESLVKAAAENKLIFIDCYTSWCGPCKEMSKYIFTDESVYTYFNEKFINVKMNMEKGEGIELAQYYKVDSYPTLLFLDTNGDVVHKVIGLISAEKLLDNAKAVNAKTQKGN